jgi:hypothetical protein
MKNKKILEESFNKEFSNYKQYLTSEDNTIILFKLNHLLNHLKK